MLSLLRNAARYSAIILAGTFPVLAILLSHVSVDKHNAILLIIY